MLQFLELTARKHFRRKCLNLRESRCLCGISRQNAFLISECRVGIIDEGTVDK